MVLTIRYRFPGTNSGRKWFKGTSKIQIQAASPNMFWPCSLQCCGRNNNIGTKSNSSQQQYNIYIYILYILYQCEKHLWYKWIVYHSVPWTIISIIVHVLHSNGKNFSAQWLAGSEQLQVLFQARVLTFQLFNLLHLGSGCFSMNPPWTPHGATKQQVLLAASNGFNGCCKDWPLADFQT